MKSASPEQIDMKPDVSIRKTTARSRKKPTAAIETACSQLTETYDMVINNFLDTMTVTSLDLVLRCKIPLVAKNFSEKVFDETDQDSRYKHLVLETYLHAIEDVQSGQEQVKRAISNLPKHKVDVMKDWCVKNCNSPYPTEKQKEEWSEQLGITISQISQWFTNYRKRVWKPHRHLMKME